MPLQYLTSCYTERIITDSKISRVEIVMQVNKKVSTGKVKYSKGYTEASSVLLN